MKAILASVLSVAVCAAVAWGFASMQAPWLDFWGWFAIFLACGVVNTLTTSPRTSGDEGPGPRIPSIALPSTHAQHAPRFERLRQPEVLVGLVALVLVVAWILMRGGAHAS